MLTNTTTTQTPERFDNEEQGESLLRSTFRVGPMAASAFALSLVIGAATMGGCSTVEGAGEDLEYASEETAEAID